MSWHRRFLFIGLALATSAWACSSSDSGGGNAKSCPPDNPNCKEIATESAGAEAVKKRKCVECHGQNMAGSTTMLPGQKPTPTGEAVELYPPNLTSDEATGVGKWTDDQLAVAIRTGIDNNSQDLCPQMKHFADMSDFEVYSIVKYLRSIPKVSSKIPRSVCPPLKTKEEQKMAQ
jgi:hypothetical protein